MAAYRLLVYAKARQFSLVGGDLEIRRIYAEDARHHIDTQAR
jgi:hypothetical protein